MKTGAILRKLVTFWGLAWVVGFSQPDVVEVTSEEALLYNLINEYRDSNNLPPIAFSKSLTHVAQTHVRDLVDNNPDVGNCNMHSWSNQGSWSACCYTSDHAQAQCMWDKPSELTNYSGSGYENAYGGSGNVSAVNALNGWKNSSGHNDVILNKNGWSNFPWGALGVGIHQGYAVIWFGAESDPEGTPTVSIQQREHLKQIQLIRGPRGYYLNLKNLSDPLQIKVRTLSGRIIQELKGITSNPQIELSHLQSGLYILEWVEEQVEGTHHTQLIHLTR